MQARRDGQIIGKGERRWLVRWYLGTGADGRKRYKAKVIHGNKKDAQAYLNATLRSRDLGEYVEPTKLTVDSFLDRWLKDGIKGSSRTRDDARYVLERYVRPYIGSLRLDRLAPLDIQAIVTAMSGEQATAEIAAAAARRAGKEKATAPTARRQYSSRTVRIALATLKQALRWAVKMRLLARNPADDVELPKKVGREMPALSPAEIGKLREALRGTKHELFFDMLLATGARPGEILAIRWRDLDLKAAALSIARAMTYEMKATEDGKRERVRVFAEPKTVRSKRTIPLPDSLLRSLAQHRATQGERAMKLGAIYDREADLVFADEIGRPLDGLNLVRRHFRPAVRRAGLNPRLRVYDLRHTHATLLLASGESVRVVSERLGHASAAMTLDVYAHVLAGQQEEATRKIEAAIFTNSGSG